MDVLDLMKERHSVRSYSEEPIDENDRRILDMTTDMLNRESGLSIQIIYDEPKCFRSMMAKYGHFENVSSYIALVGNKSLADLEERCGYYGEKLVLKAQEIGLNTCWVGLTHGSTQSEVHKGQKEVIIISLGHGADDGHPHQNKDVSKLADLSDDDPRWYTRGVEGALLAPTAINQQKFHISRSGNEVEIKAVGHGAYSLVDLGIVKCHFEMAAGKTSFSWK